MTCAGRCFDIKPLKPVIISEATVRKEQSQLPTSVRPRARFAYTPLRPWQTRVIRLYPVSTCYADGVASKGQLQADLIVVNLILMPGLVAIEGTNDMVAYSALSYTWGRPKLSYSLLCNGASKQISLENATALKTLQHPNEVIYLWIDAICINQDDFEEKSTQVAQMLDIFQKAECVIAWLGESDRDSLLAFALFTHLRSSSAGETLAAASDSSHTNTCHKQTQLVYEALLSFSRRPWFQRTWVRQEIYGAKRLLMQCGTHQVAWEDFVRAVSTMEPFASVSSLSHERKLVSHALADAQLNARSPPRGSKPIRNLLEVLLSSGHFKVSDTRDTVYAILGMCGVITTAKAVEASIIRQDVSTMHFPVDYSKSTNNVYSDITLYILDRPGREGCDLADLWHSYKRSPRHASGLPSWAVDWRVGLLDFSDQSTIKHNMRSVKATKRDLREMDLNLGDSLLPIPRSTVYNKWAEPSVWHWPEIDTFDRNVLKIKVRVLNYVAYLTDFTWELNDFTSVENVWLSTFPGLQTKMFSDIDSSSRNHRLGLASETIHASDRPRPNAYLLNNLPITVQAFKPGIHTWRLAILGIAHLQQQCLVPATTKRGDLVIAIAPDVLPMVIHPIHGDGTAGGLFKLKDPYEEVAFGESALLGADDVLAIALRRRAVLAHLDNTVKTIGEDFEFHGPLFVRTQTPKYHIDYLFAAKLAFARTVVSSNLTKKRPHIHRNEIMDLFWQVHRQDRSWSDSSINDRPIQELRLH